MKYEDMPFDDSKYLTEIREYLSAMGLRSTEVNQFEFFTDKHVQCVAAISRKKTGSVLRVLTSVPEFNQIKKDLGEIIK